MFKEIIPTRGCSSLLNKSLHFAGYVYCFFFQVRYVLSAEFCKKQNCSANPVSLSKEKILLMPVRMPLCPMLHTAPFKQTVCILEIPPKPFSFPLLLFVSLGQRLCMFWIESQIIPSCQKSIMVVRSLEFSICIYFFLNENGAFLFQTVVVRHHHIQASLQRTYPHVLQSQFSSVTNLQIKSRSSLSFYTKLIAQIFSFECYITHISILN